MVAVGDPPGGVRRIDRRGQRLEQILGPLEGRRLDAVGRRQTEQRIHGAGRGEVAECAAEKIGDGGAQRRVSTPGQNGFDIAPRKHFQDDGHVAGLPQAND